MLVYEGIKTDFIKDVDLNMIVDRIYERYQQYFGKTTESQLNSWQNSMQYMRGILSTDEIPNNCGIAIEFNIPTTSKRIDFIVSGYDKLENETAIIIELKQWESCKAIPDMDGLVSTYVGHAIRQVAHPSYQAMSYANLIRDFNAAAQDYQVGLFPCAFLHNYHIRAGDPICNEQYHVYIKKAPVFGKLDFSDFREFIKEHISNGDDGKTLYRIENGKLRPSKRLQDTIGKMLHGNHEFDLIDTQKVIYENVKKLTRQSVLHNKKNVIIVEGGPGTGKSVLAINLLADITSQMGFVCQYVTKNGAPRSVFKKKLKGDQFKDTFIDGLFKGSGSFIDSQSNKIDCIVVDEAHRLNAKSGMFRNLGENQIKEIINAAKTSVFFIDEDQRVTLQDIGSTELIQEYADQLDAEIIKYKLDSQFRCNGSDGYLAWLDNLLDIHETANFMTMDFDYEFFVCDSPNELRSRIEILNQKNNKSRLVAGYCWNWISEGKNNPDIHDITIPGYNFSASWNLNNTATWAIDPNSVNEIGCIHTCQGLEFDYVGVIIGDDIRYENGKVVTDFTKRASTDQSLKGIKKLYKEDPNQAEKIADRIIKNTYRTLMTRGMKGCYIFCTDKNLQNYIKERINLSRKYDNLVD